MGREVILLVLALTAVLVVPLSGWTGGQCRGRQGDGENCLLHEDDFTSVLQMRSHRSYSLSASERVVTCQGTAYNQEEDCPTQAYCMGYSSCCNTTGQCLSSTTNTCQLAASCDPAVDNCGQNSGFPPYVDSKPMSVHNPSFKDGCSCDIANDDCVPSNGANKVHCWGVLTCDNKPGSSCTDDGMCLGNHGSAPVGSFCQDNGVGNTFKFCGGSNFTTGAPTTLAATPAPTTQGPTTPSPTTPAPTTPYPTTPAPTTAAPTTPAPTTPAPTTPYPTTPAPTTPAPTTPAPSTPAPTTPAPTTPAPTTPYPTTPYPTTPAPTTPAPTTPYPTTPYPTTPAPTTPYPTTPAPTTPAPTTPAPTTPAPTT
eukprot:CAMPEP_0206482542 /NCGR_PEP_ID=MMETSP0324_2-20121206/38931_1 /ASSEMBLY_ACC=CAM_ASM_000836 /TAXON_ID=2866 /ORGANISM="Crypthecodinium cohnii, Strain Seligo" /LENGTH=366 /DNA_ID=CAMNT_0053960499 /DNA_START=50 /DNA_END=1146 /DNA_ORIENTATION=-